MLLMLVAVADDILSIKSSSFICRSSLKLSTENVDKSRANFALEQYLSSVAHLQKSNKKKVGDFTSRINQRSG